MTELVNTELYSDSRFSTRSYREMSNRVNGACEWLVDHGLAIEVTRIGEYRECLCTLAEHYDNGTLERLENAVEFPEMVNSVWEASELIRIHEGLRAVVSTDLDDKPSRFIKGPGKKSVSRKDDPGRDVAFELGIAARFARAGFDVDFGTDADIKIPLPDCTLYLECKRPKSQAKVDRHVSASARQLRRRYASAGAGETPKGVLALSLSMVINPGGHLLVAETRSELDAKVRHHTDAFVKRHQHRWMKRVALDGSTLGVLLVLDLPTIIEERHLLSTYHEFAVNNTCAVNSSDMELLLSMAEKLRVS